MPNILIAVGGTGGHVIPAQVVARQLIQAGCTVHFAGHGLSFNPYFSKTWEYTETCAAPPSLKKPLAFFSKTISGTVQALTMPRYSLIIGFGSYHTVPILTAACLARRPFVLYEANAIPGRVIRLFSRFALWTGCFFDAAASHFHGKAKSVDHPIRASFDMLPDPSIAKKRFCLPAGKTLLVIGGSQGSGIFNEIVPEAAAKTNLSVLHIAGHKANINAIKERYARLNVSAFVIPYEENMEYAYAACDILLSRAGASAICEIERAGKPALYIPFKGATDNHQMKNAALAVKRGNALLLDESAASPEAIATLLEQLSPIQKRWTPRPNLTTCILQEAL